MEWTVYRLPPFVSTAHSLLLQTIRLALLSLYERRITKHWLLTMPFWDCPSPFKSHKLCVYTINCVFFSKALCPWCVCLLQQSLHWRSFNLSLQSHDWWDSQGSSSLLHFWPMINVCIDVYLVLCFSALLLTLTHAWLRGVSLSPHSCPCSV